MVSSLDNHIRVVSIGIDFNILMVFYLYYTLRIQVNTLLSKGIEVVSSLSFPVLESKRRHLDDT